MKRSKTGSPGTDSPGTDSSGTNSSGTDSSEADSYEADSSGADSSGADSEADRKKGSSLRRGWTTGACATAATKAALEALLTGCFPDSATIRLPRGERPCFGLALAEADEEGRVRRVGIVKDAGDDPDVTHGATIIASVREGRSGEGVTFKAGEGVGMVTKPGLPIPPGEPAVNPSPRKMMREVVEEVCARFGRKPDIEITLSIPNGEAIAEKTWNRQLGIIGGLSILGTTGIVHPYSCSAWIHSIRSGVDVCRANGIEHALAATGSTSRQAGLALYDMPEIAVLDMGDFVGGLLKHLRNHPLPRVTIAGGFAKMAKLARGAMDLHSARSRVDMEWLSRLCLEANGSREKAEAIRSANTALEALEIARTVPFDPAESVAREALERAEEALRDSPTRIEVVVIGRRGEILARADRFDG